MKREPTIGVRRNHKLTRRLFPNRFRLMWLGAGLVVVASTAISTAAMAEEHGDVDVTEVTSKNVISTNPILDMFTWFNIEYERRIAANGTIGLTTSYLDYDDDEGFLGVSVFYRFYPQDRAPSGFFFGGRFGGYSEEKETAFGFGIDIAYSWLLGKPESFSVSLGIGALRLFGGSLDTAETVPTLRIINIGFAF